VLNASAEAGEDDTAPGDDDDSGRGVNESNVCRPTTLPALALRATDANFRTIDGDTIDGGCGRGDASGGCGLRFWCWLKFDESMDDNDETVPSHGSVLTRDGLGLAAEAVGVWALLFVGALPCVPSAIDFLCESDGDDEDDKSMGRADASGDEAYCHSRASRCWVDTELEWSAGVEDDGVYDWWSIVTVRRGVDIEAGVPNEPPNRCVRVVECDTASSTRPAETWFTIALPSPSCLAYSDSCTATAVRVSTVSGAARTASALACNRRSAKWLARSRAKSEGGAQATVDEDDEYDDDNNNDEEDEGNARSPSGREKKKKKLR
jgi:hypothetical protein